MYLQEAVEGSAGPVTHGASERVTDLDVEWAQWRAKIEALLGTDVPALNALAAQKGVPAVIVKSKPKVAS